MAPGVPPPPRRFWRIEAQCCGGQGPKECVKLEKPTLWSRVGHWFKRSPRPVGYGLEDAPAGGLGPTSGVDGDIGIAPHAASAAEGRGSLSRFRFSRSGPNLERLEEEYARIVNLMESIQTHLASQAERSDIMARSLDRLAEGLAQVPEASRRHLELLSTISDAATADAASAKRVEEGLVQLPQLADAQRETMVSLGRQLDLSRQTSERVADTMDQFREAVTKLSEATGASTRTLREMHQEAEVRDERAASLLQVQTRRLTMFAWSAIGLAVIVAVVGLIALFSQQT